MSSKTRTDGLVAGVDIGGTNIRIALSHALSPTEIITRDSFDTPALEGPVRTVEMIAERVIACLRQVGMSRDHLQSLGCTVPGVTDARKGESLFVSNLRGWDGFPVADRLMERLDVPVSVENDVNAAAYGEYRFGSGVDCHSIVYLTVSTGVAAGIVVEGHVLRGFHHAAGELGFFVPDPQFLSRDWHPNGCLELMSAGIGLAHRWADVQGKAVEDVSAKDVFDAAKQGHIEAQHIIDEAANYLGQAAVAICTILDPERLVLGGSVAQHQAVIEERIRAVLHAVIPNPPEILLSVLKGDAPLIGALALASHLHYTSNGIKKTP